MTCSYCATELPSGAMFCGECGRAVEASSGVTARAAATGPAPVESEELIEPPLSSYRAPRTIPSKSSDFSEADPAINEVCAQCGTSVAASDIFCGECGFVRQSAAARPRDTVSLDPFPWGSRENLNPAARASTTISDSEVDDDEQTRLVHNTATGDRFVLQFSTGESVSVTGTGLLGRNPLAEPGEYFDTLISISDPGKSVSKTHLEFGQDDGAFWVSDRFSGNGTVVRQPDIPPRRCDHGKRYRIVRGTRVEIGEQFFIVS